MATKKPTTGELASKIQEAGIQLFKDRAGYPLSQAQRNLEGRTHYVDDSTLAFFSAKILACHIFDDGLILGIVESLKAGPDDDAGRIYRPVYFDLFGNTVLRPEVEDSFKTQKQAMAALWTMADEVDAQDATIAGIKEKQKMLQDEIDKLDVLAKQFK